MDEREPTDEELDTLEGMAREIALYLLHENPRYERETQEWRDTTYSMTCALVKDDLSLEHIDTDTVKHITFTVVHDLNRLPNRFPKRD